MFCIVKFPEDINNQNKDLYHRAALELLHKLDCIKLFDDIVAIGPTHMESFWPGKYWNILSSTEDKILHWAKSDHILIIGIDAPFLSHGTIKKFISSYTSLNSKDKRETMVTFRKTIDQKNIARMEYGGKNILAIHCKDGFVNIKKNIDKSSNINDKAINVRLSGQNVSLYTEISLQIFKKNISLGTYEYYTIEKKNNSFFTEGRELNRLEHQDRHTINLSDDEEVIIFVSEHISDCGLYSKIHYTYQPVAIEGMIAFNSELIRVNLQNGKRIHGRQAYPEIYEPFLGMGLVDIKTAVDIICKGDKWFRSQKQLLPYMVSGIESKLIKDNSFLSKYTWCNKEAKYDCRVHC